MLGRFAVALRVLPVEGCAPTHREVIPEWSLRTPDGVERALHTVDGAIAAKPSTPATAFSNRSKLHASLREFERDETKRLRKETQLPMDAATPKTICWMEVR